MLRKPPQLAQLAVGTERLHSMCLKYVRQRLRVRRNELPASFIAIERALRVMLMDEPWVAQALCERQRRKIVVLFRRRNACFFR